ncbi:5-oxoprolinase subunit PxpB [Chitinibacter bivalviorum]|uniref:5-oxoprolinase subunit PxpB n=1 Tax=Chitinibacter bivalviorum TaxID=2739434 RepID=A0A7H9BF96_9NEIS|nr:5-oxoprolinase subunit PxpB [Chitinibacter bivalviorum]QLG86906.1 5-oxoprolinase subunit PxpB [Chitinibacter bivalviorum]
MSALMIYPLGETAMVLQAGLEQQDRLITMVRRFDAKRTTQMYQLILGVGNITLRFNPLQQHAAAALEWLQMQWSEAESIAPYQGVVHHIEVQYGADAGPDLDVVAQHCQMTAAQVIEAHATPLYQVLCIGFLPGFPYLAGLPTALATPRRESPRLSVAAGSVGIGGAQTGIYPCESPGGWQLIGRSKQPLFNPNAAQPCLLQAGDRVRFVPVERL